MKHKGWNNPGGTIPGWVWVDKGGWRVAHDAKPITRGKDRGRLRVTLALGKKRTVDRIYPLCDDDNRS